MDDKEQQHTNAGTGDAPSQDDAERRMTRAEWEREEAEKRAREADRKRAEDRERHRNRKPRNWKKFCCGALRGFALSLFSSSSATYRTMSSRRRPKLKPASASRNRLKSKWFKGAVQTSLGNLPFPERRRLLLRRSSMPARMAILRSAMRT